METSFLKEDKYGGKGYTNLSTDLETPLECYITVSGNKDIPKKSCPIIEEFRDKTDERQGNLSDPECDVSSPESEDENCQLDQLFGINHPDPEEELEIFKDKINRLILKLKEFLENRRYSDKKYLLDEALKSFVLEDVRSLILNDRVLEARQLLDYCTAMINSGSDEKRNSLASPSYRDVLISFKDPEKNRINLNREVLFRFVFPELQFSHVKNLNPDSFLEYDFLEGYKKEHSKYLRIKKDFESGEPPTTQELIRFVQYVEKNICRFSVPPKGIEFTMEEVEMIYNYFVKNINLGNKDYFGNLKTFLAYHLPYTILYLKLTESEKKQVFLKFYDTLIGVLPEEKLQEFSDSIKGSLRLFSLEEYSIFLNEL